MTQKNVLGKGLGALLTTQINKNALLDRYIQDIPIEYISVNPFQPRQDFDIQALHKLSESIKEYGVIQPITLRKIAENKYELISGERRLQACKIANLTHIPGYIRTADDTKMLEMALVENIQREDLNPIEIALSYQRLIAECNTTQQVIADKVGKDRATVSNYIRLLKLPPEIQVALRDSTISMGHARAIINIESVELQLRIFNEIIAKNLSVREVEEKVKRSIPTNPTKIDNINSQSPHLPQMVYVLTQNVSEQLSKNLKTKVKIYTAKSGKGEIKITFKSIPDLERLSNILQQNDQANKN